MRQIVFDTETTGFDPDKGDRVVEIGAIELVNGAITGRNFHVYVNPERDMPDGAYQVHGLSSEFLSDKPLFKDPKVGKAFLDFVDDAELIAHNAKFDMKFMQWELDNADLPTLENDVIDTVAIARRKFPGAPASLDALCSRFGIDTSERERDGHGALLDSRLLAEVYIELTGGAQAGLDLGSQNIGGGDSAVRLDRPERSAPLPSRLSESEKAAHAAFVATLNNPLWNQR